MPKKIRLLWKDGNRLVDEECFLIEEDDVIYIHGTEIPLHFTPDYFMSRNLVLLEDDEGLFCLRPDQIVFIDGVENDN